MTLKVTIEGGDRVAKFIKDRLPTVTEAVVVRMNALLIRLQTYIVGQKLSGQVLHHRSGHLIDSIRLEPPQPVIEGTRVIGGVQGAGPIAWYGKIHEYGGTFGVKEHVRKALSPKGMAYERTIKAHSVTFPERSFMRSSVTDMRDQIVAGLQGAINEALSK